MAVVQSPIIEDREWGIIRMLTSNDGLNTLAALDLLDSMVLDTLFPVPPQSRTNIEKQIAVYAIPLLKHNDAAIRGRAARQMLLLPDVVSAPLVIPMITDPDKWVRAQVRSPIGSIVANGHIKSDEIQTWLKLPLNQDDSDMTPKVQALMQGYWSSIRAKRMGKELPRIKAKLNSKSAVERESAAKLLELVRHAE